MNKQAILGALGVISLALPAGAQAYDQGGYGGQDGYRDGARAGYGRPNDNYGGYGSGGYDRDRYDRDDYAAGGYDWRSFRGYPELRGVEDHIRREIVDAVRQDMIDRDGAEDLFAQLREIRLRENRAFQRYGWRLPQDEHHHLRWRLDRLDREVDRIRQEPEG